MDKKHIEILIVENNRQFGNSLKDAIVNAGYQATLATTPKEALYYHKIHFISGFIIDCLLPDIAALDLALKFREIDKSNEKPLFFMSSVFKKEEIFTELQAKTNACDFLSKPFPLDELVKKLDQKFLKYIKPNRDSLTTAFIKQYLSSKERVSIVSEVKKIHGFKLPQVIKLLLYDKISGTLKLTTENKKEQRIYFFNGAIISVEVNQKDDRSFFGDILIKKNILSFEEIQPFLDEKASNKNIEKIGLRLVKANLMSPHIIGIITKEQVSMRLMSLIKDVYYNISFEENLIQTNKQSTSIKQKELHNIYIEYLISQLPIKQVKNTYLNKLNYQIHTTSDFSISNFTFPACQETIKILKSIQKENHSILSLLNKYPKLNNDVYFILHLLLINQMIYLQYFNLEETLQTKILRLKKISQDLNNQNHFEVLNVSKKSQVSDVTKAFKNLSMIFYPNAENTQGSKEIEILLNDIFNKIKTAYTILSDKKKRKDYELSLEYGNFKCIAQSKQLFEEGKKALHINNRKTALELLHKAVDMSVDPSAEMRLYLIWSQLLNSSTQDKSSNKIVSIQMAFNTIPPEYRNTALFYFVKGLFYKELGDKEAALQHIKYAVHLDHNLKEAKQELQALSYTMKKPINILKGDLKDVLKAIPFFNRRSG